MRTTSLGRRGLAVVAAACCVAVAGCGSDDETQEGTDTGVDLTSAPEAYWSPVAGIAVPTADDGKCPEKTDPVRHGYAHTPQCAVIAAINGQTLLATTGDNAWPAMANTIIAPGPGKDQWVQARSLMSVNGSVKDPAVFQGFKITDYSEERAQVMLAVKWPDGTLTAQPTQLIWQGGDWRLVLPTQQTAVDATAIDTLDGFTTFTPE